ncbi:MAG: peptidylprolyl isomerase [Myxococcota bacterium]
MPRKLSHPRPAHLDLEASDTKTLLERSQRTQWEVRERDLGRRARRRDLVIAVILTITAVTACNQTDGARSPSEESGRDRAVEDAPSHPTDLSQPFKWPHDSPHPRLILEIEMKDRNGTIELELLPELSPRSVDSVVRIARSGAYDGTTFHRVIPDFMIQGGDPNTLDRDPSNDGRGGNAIAIPDEGRNAPLVRSAVALANHGLPGSNSTQFFIMLSDNRSLDGKYNVIGYVKSGMGLVDAIAGTETDRTGRWGPKDRPIANVTIRRVTTTSPQAKN